MHVRPRVVKHDTALRTSNTTDVAIATMGVIQLCVDVSRVVAVLNAVTITSLLPTLIFKIIKSSPTRLLKNPKRKKFHNS